MEDMLIKFITQRKRTVGCVIAKKFPETNRVFVTGSLCRKGVDKFSKDEAVTIAVERATAMALLNRSCPVPYSLKEDIDYMAKRAERYFQNCSVRASIVKDLPGTEKKIGFMSSLRRAWGLN